MWELQASTLLGCSPVARFPLGGARRACWRCWWEQWRQWVMVAGRGDIGSVTAPPPPTSSLPKPPQGCGPPPSRRPVARLATASQDSATAKCAAEPPRVPNPNPYGLSDDVLLRKQQFDRARAHKNSAVRAVRCLYAAAARWHCGTDASSSRIALLWRTGNRVAPSGRCCGNDVTV